MQKRFDALLQAQGVERSGRWDGHHLHFLWYAALMEGRSSLSLQTARDYAQRFGKASGSAGAYAQLLPWVSLVRLQRWDAVLAEPVPAAPAGPGQGAELLQVYVAHARGLAQLHTGQLALAKAELATVERLQPLLKDATLWGEKKPPKMATLLQTSLAGAIARAEGRHEAAIALLRQAADLDDELGNDPPMLGGGARLTLAGALLAAGQLDEAEREIQEAQRLNGPSTWVHLALAQLAERRGAQDEGSRQVALAKAAWRAADGAELPRL
ncbi:MAG: tetratricopeptide repeat protein [Burkholderiales bacterium]|nr:tetratricopeptide repeat protein [Burkholderiales bacterium]